MEQISWGEGLLKGSKNFEGLLFSVYVYQYNGFTSLNKGMKLQKYKYNLPHGNKSPNEVTK